MVARIHIDLNQGMIEAEGSEDFVKDVYNDYRNLLESKHGGTQVSRGKAARKKTVELKQKNGQKSKKTQPGTERLKLVDNLEITRSGNIPSLNDFYSIYSTRTNLERNLIFTYYLIEKRGKASVSIHDLYTCYRRIPKLKMPKHLTQSLRDTKTLKGWIDTSDMNLITLADLGRDHLDIEMDKSDSEKNE